MIVIISRPTAEVVSHQLSPRLTNPQDARQLGEDVVKVARRTRQAVQLGHHDHIAGQ